MRTLLNTLKWAEGKKVAVPHFNIAGFEQFKAVAETAKGLKLPVIVGVSEGERDYLGVRQVRDLLTSYNEEYGDKENDGGFWLFLNADHTHDLGKVKDAAENRFGEILFDGGKLGFGQDEEQTTEAVKIVKELHPEILVEGEMGYIGSSSEVWDKIPEGAAIDERMLTKPEEAKQFVEATGIDILAPAVGNIHGMFRNAPNPRLNIERIKEIKAAVGIPLVLHGGSGIVDEDFTAAIEAGINIIHISTEIRVAWRKGLEEGLKANPDVVAPYHITPLAIAAMERVIGARMKLFYKQ